MATILIPDYLGQHVRAGIRALVRGGDTCDLAWAVCRVKSAYVRDFHLIVASEVDDRQYVSDVVALCHDKGYDMILPFGNASYYALAKHRDVLIANDIRCMVPDFATFRVAHDKYQTMELCRRIGVRTPELFTEYAENDIHAIASHLRYPVVVKAKSGVGVFTGLRYANNKEELIQSYEEISSYHARTGASDFDSPMIQEFIPGFINDACTVTDQGRVVAVLTQQRHIMFPIYGGVGAVNVTTHNPALGGLAREILEELEWHGPAQIEFKYDPRDHEYKLIEINPKLWGTLDLSIQVGYNFPRMIRNLLLGEKVDVPKHYPSGVRYKFWLSQAVLAYLQLARGFGLRELFDLTHYRKTYNDLDARDGLYELYRGYLTLRELMSGRHRSPNANISKRYINRVNSGHSEDKTH